MTAPTPPDYSEWKYRAAIQITNPIATANFQHKLTLAWHTGMRSDFRDVRFTLFDGTNCPFWIESYTAQTSATIWIKIPPASQTRLYLYYGNGHAPNGSNGSATFEFFDGFEYTDALTNHGWSLTGSGFATSTEQIRNGSRSLKQDTTGLSHIDQTTALSASILEIDFYDTGGHSTSEADVISYDDATNLVLVGVYDVKTTANYSYRFGATFYDSGVARSSGWHTFKIVYNGSEYVVYIDDAEIATSGSAYGAPTRISIGSWWTSKDSLSYWDGVRIRKYTSSTEPTLTVGITGKVNPAIQQIRPPRKISAIITLSTGNDYAFDPVNINHGMAAAIGAQEIELAANINHGMVAAIGSQEIECGAVNIYHAIYPTATWNRIISPYDDNPTLIAVDVTQGMDDPMCQAVFQYDTDTVGNIFGNDYMTRIIVTIPDYLGTLRPVFIGIAPSSRATYSPAADKMTLTAVDYGLYLTKQTLEDADLALLPPDDQDAEGANVAKVLSYDYVVKPFQLGMHVVGQMSGSTGTIIEIVQTSTGGRMTLYPAQGKFLDDELLRVGSVDYARADGRSVDIPYTPYYSVVYPEDWVKRVLGGDNWMRVTGIEPYRLTNSADYWDTEDCPAIPFMFGSLEKKFEAIKRIAKYMRYIFLVKIRDAGGGNYVPSAYFVKESEIDDPSDGLDLPAAATITGPDDPYLAAPIELEQNGENQVDLVRVMCQDLQGNWLEVKRSNSRVDAGEGPYREFRDEPQDICTLLDLEAYADDMFTLYSQRGATWHATLVERPDLQLYQLLTISGFGSKIPDGSYRIIKIRYERSCAKNLTHISFMLASAFSTLLRYGITYTDSISEVKRIMQHEETLKPQTELATVTATDGWTLTFTTEAGNAGRGRDGTSTPTTEGAIPVGAKILVQNIRGGVVCIPVVAASGSSTDLLVVDEPLIVSATEDPDDSNYWFLEWTPGANNQHVSVNIQISEYPPEPGVVTGPGSVTKLYPITTQKIRVRFSGPLTTYYIKIWGEKNGIFSTTGDTAFITSSADVTVGDAEEPEEIMVIDLKLTDQIEGFDSAPGYQFYTLWEGTLSFLYGGSGNIYLSGPAEDPGYEGHTQPAPFYAFMDNDIRITGPGGVLWFQGGTDPYGGLKHHGWKPPCQINSILVQGENTLKIELFDWYLRNGRAECSELWIRSYYL